MKRLIYAFILLLLLFSFIPGSLLAQSDIAVSSSTGVTFPTSITFNMTAESSADISQIFLRYRVSRISTVKVTTVVQPEFIPSPAVEISWTWDMKKMLGSLPPGVEVAYSWRVKDVLEREFETEWQYVRFDDDRYSWNMTTDSDITLYWYQGDQTFASELLDTANEALERLAVNAGAVLDYPVDIYIYASSQELRNAILYSQEWMGGAAFPQYSTIALGISENSLESGRQLLTHELAHIVTFQMTFNPYNDIPTWLDEGISMYAEGDLRFDMMSALDNAISDDDLLSVQTISSNFPADYNEALLSYAESYSVVAYLLEEFGADKMLQLLSTFKRGSSYDEALLSTYGFDTAGLDGLWRLSLGLEPRPSATATSQYATPTPGSEDGGFGCQASSGTSHSSLLYSLSMVGLILLPGIGELTRRIFIRGRAEK